MKIGTEVEGRLRGVPTIFCSVEEYVEAIACAVSYGISHVYISDPRATLDYDRLAKYPSIQFTVDTISVNGPRPANVTIMLALLAEVHAEISKLGPDDQVKASVGHTSDVFVVPMRNFIITKPAEFAGDKQI